jgi:hypothetical protein
MNEIELSPAAVAAETLGAMVDAIGETERLHSCVMAVRAVQIDQARRYAELTVPVTTSEGMVPWSQKETAERTLVSELATALTMPELTIQRLVKESEALVHDLTATLGALKDGTISYRHAQVVINQVWDLPAEARAEFEAHVLPFASSATVAKFERKVRKLRERMHPATIIERHEKCVADRTITLDPAQDGMAYLTNYLPAVDAFAIYNRLTDAAVAAQGPTEPRTLTQLRSDAATTLLLGGVGTQAGRDGNGAGTQPTPTNSVNGVAAIKPWVAITVPALSLLGLDDGPATLEGYGPIDINTAAALCADAPSFVRILSHPETGAVLSVGRDRYAIPADLRTWLRVRDGTCRMPGCNRAAARCDVDHTVEWQHGGQTSHDNLAHLCPKHHALKHHSGWKVKHRANGTMEWTSPTGHTYLSEPANSMRA